MEYSKVIGKCIYLFIVLAISMPVLAADKSAKSDSAGDADSAAVEAEQYNVAVIDMGGTAILRPDVDIVSLSGTQETFDLMSMAGRLRAVIADDNVDALLITLDHPEMTMGQVDYFRGIIKEVQKAGKKVHVYAENYSQVDYLLAAGADTLVMTRSGEVDLHGLLAESLYFKGTMDKLGIGADMISIGRFKSAGEQMTRTGPSQAEQLQMDELLDDIYGHMTGIISEAKGIDKNAAAKLIDEGPYSAREALDAGLVDQVMYRDEFVSFLENQYGEVSLTLDYGYVFKGSSFEGKSLFGIMQELFSPEPAFDYDNDMIAVVTLDGVIVSGGGDTYDGSSCGSETIRNALKECRNNDKIKGVVISINSPGGSAMASDVIYHAIRQTAAVKPVVVSMGTVAASGGYYTACGADTIFADATTITGSIGVIGGKIYFGDLLDKIGIGYHKYARGQNAGMLSSNDKFSPLEKQKIATQMLETYSLFKERVLATRMNKIDGELENHAQGRVFSGDRAMKLGLVDRLGSFEDALDYVSRECGLEGKEYAVLWMPRPQTFMEVFESLLASAPSDSDDKTASVLSDVMTGVLSSNLGSYAKPVKQIFTMIKAMSKEQVMTVMPYQLMLEY